MYKINEKFSGQLVGSDRIYEYIHGGKAVVTLKSPTGAHHTYVFEKPKEPTSFPEDVIFVYALHEKRKMFYVGMVEKGVFRLTTNSRFLNTTPIVKGARYIMKMANDSTMVTPMQLFHEGICSVCGRPLTNPKSIEFGMGPRCRKSCHGNR